jgi:hypothetical protein
MHSAAVAPLTSDPMLKSAAVRAAVLILFFAGGEGWKGDPLFIPSLSEGGATKPPVTANRITNARKGKLSGFVFQCFFAFRMKFFLCDFACVPRRR